VIGSELGAAISPTAIGGAPIKVGMLVQKKIKPGTAITMTLLGSIEDGLFFLIAIPFTLTIASAWKMPFITDFFNRIFSSIYMILLVIAAIFLLYSLYRFFVRRNDKNNSQFIFLPSFIHKMVTKGKKTWTDCKIAYQITGRKGKTRLLLTTSLSAVQWICRYSVITALAASLGISVDPILFFGLQWIVFTLMTLIPTPGATGGAEASFYLIYHTLLPYEFIGLIMAGWRFLTFYFLLGFGALLFSVLYYVRKKQQHHAVKTDLVMSE
jgi:uncharacterized protein (TIRG00374 family)